MSYTSNKSLELLKENESGQRLKFKEIFTEWKQHLNELHENEDYTEKDFIKDFGIYLSLQYKKLQNSPIKTPFD